MDKKKKYKQPVPAVKTPAKKVKVDSFGAWKQTAALFILLLLVFIVYKPSLQGGFVWDDDHYIQHNPLIYSFNLKALFSSYVMGNYHPLTMLVYTIEYHFFGLGEKGYHAVNLFIHLLNVALVFYSLRLLSRKPEVALVAALLFGVHPMHVESVAWASELKDLLYTFFFLAAYICYLKYLEKRKIIFYLCCALLFICSMFSKGMAVCFPVVMVLTDYFLPYLRNSAEKVRKVTLKVWLEKIPFFILSAIFGVVAVFAQKSTEAMNSELNYSFIDRITIACYGFVNYIVKLVAPVNLCAYYPYPVKVGNVNIPVEYYAYVAGFIVLAGIVYYSTRFTKKVLFGFGFFSVTIFLVLQLLPVGSAIMADRYSYVASIGIFYLAGEGFYWLWEKKKWVVHPKAFALVLLIAFTVFFSLRTQAMCEVWKNSMNLWTDVINKFQNVPYAYNNRGILLMNDNKEEAISDFNKAIFLRSAYPEARNNRGVVFYGEKKYPEALEDFNAALDARPGYAEAYNHRGLLNQALKKNKEAEADFNRAIELMPDFSKAYYNRGTFFIEQGNYDKALDDYNKAIEIDPGSVDAYNNRGNLLSIQKKFTEAIHDYDMVLALSPDNINAYFNRGTLFMNEKKNEEAVRDFDKVVELQPNNASAYYNKATIEYTMGRKEDACVDLKKAMDLGYQPAGVLFNQICH